MKKKLFVTILSFLLVLTIVVQAFPENKVYAQEDALGNTVTYTYNFQTGTMTTATDANGNVTSYTYNNSDQLTSVSQGGVSVNYTYDENNQLSSIAHNGFNYIFTYDALGRSKTTSVGNRTLVTNLYDEATGLLDTATYGNGDTRKYTYDDQQRVVKLTIDGIDKFSYTYDSRGNIHSATDLVQGVTYKYLYDFVGRPVQVRTSQGFVIKITYDEYNRASDVKFGFGSDTLTTEWRYGETDSFDLSQKNGVIYGVSYNGVEKVTYKYDNLGRRTSTTLNTTTPFVTSYGFKDLNYKNTSTQLSYVSYSNGTAYNYAYDTNGNITNIIDPAGYDIVKYYYDELNQLTREDNAQLNKTITYTYDNGGNILSVNEYAYTTGALGNIVSQKVYTYGDTNWRDLLTNYNGVNINYDAVGNPTNWINGESFTWSGGRQLTGVTKNGSTISYAYDDNGIRTSKTVNGIRTNYYLDGTNVVMQKTGDNVIWYTYDENGLATGFRYNGNEYYYFRNGQNDIIGIIDSSGAIVAQYTYDSWGKHISITDGSGNDVSGNANHIANINPLRYRGYYFDAETGFYYVASRFYDAVIGRWINSDSQLNASLGVIGLNLFAYCLNDPTNLVDYNGNKPGDLFDTMDDAAIDFALNYNYISIKDNKEYGSFIYQVTHTEKETIVQTKTYRFLWWTWTKDKKVTIKKKVIKYSYVKPNVGNSNKVNIPINFFWRYKKVAEIHTHAAYDWFSDYNETFSPGDIALDYVNYLVTPLGKVIKHDFPAYDMVEIYSSAAQDKNHPALNRGY